ncbi:hypothetical protein HNQ49_001981 [Parapusillimonas granuli]|nr:hypothetical protein [Parapusillimonas granuli]
MSSKHSSALTPGNLQGVVAHALLRALLQHVPQ